MKFNQYQDGKDEMAICIKCGSKHGGATPRNFWVCFNCQRRADHTRGAKRDAEASRTEDLGTATNKPDTKCDHTKQVEK